MMFKVIVVVLCSMQVFAEETNSGKEKEHHHHHKSSETVHNLLKSYDRVVRPGGDQALVINVSMHIIHMVWAKNELTLTAFVRHKWTDNRLTSSEAGKPFVINNEEISPRIWEPDTFIPEATDRQILDHGFVRIDGHDLLMSQMLKLKIPCRGSIGELYTNDGTMKCHFSLESYGLTEEDLKYTWSTKGSKPVSWSEPMNSGLNITSIKTEVTTLNLVNLGKRYSKLQVNIEFRTPFWKRVFDYLTPESIQKIV